MLCVAAASSLDAQEAERNSLADSGRDGVVSDTVVDEILLRDGQLEGTTRFTAARTLPLLA
jgi:hypothetical protein